MPSSPVLLLLWFIVLSTLVSMTSLIEWLNIWWEFFTAPKLSWRDMDTGTGRQAGHYVASIYCCRARSDEWGTTLKIPILSTWSPPYGYTFSVFLLFYYLVVPRGFFVFVSSRLNDLAGQVVNLWKGYCVRWPGAIPLASTRSLYTTTLFIVLTGMVLPGQVRWWCSFIKLGDIVSCGLDSSGLEWE